MSVQFGKWNFDGKPVTPDYLAKVKPLLNPYGPDGSNSYFSEGISMLHCAFHTTLESRRESQPHITPSGAIITWDGRLDNRIELIKRLADAVTANSTDVEIVGASYEYWGSACFAMLLGDWALSLWDPHKRSLILAKDPVGTRHLYYACDSNQVAWSTILDPLVLFAGKTFALSEEYIAGWFSFFPAAHLTPYVGIQAVPPSSFVLLQRGKHAVSKYWDFDPSKKIRYGRDAEYEEHFRVVFGEAVRRCLRSDSPILAELSGGMDSSSIVCMGDTIMARGDGETPRLDTVSYYDDSEPNWNERPYFAKVEEKRGRTGCHIEVGSQNRFSFGFRDDRFPATPASSICQSEAVTEFIQCISSQGNRVVLSGVGGDEVLGGVPTPIPELADLLVKARVPTLAHQLKEWALAKRKPWLHLLFETGCRFLPHTLVRAPRQMRPPNWLHHTFIRKHSEAVNGYVNRLKLLGPTPSFQDNISCLDGLRRQLACSGPPPSPTYEKRYPYFDRSLLEFLFGVPTEQLVRPRQRRSLMRRALVGLVPDEILNRKRKAFVARGPAAAISSEWTSLSEISRNMICSSMKIVDAEAFWEALQKGRSGVDIGTIAFVRAVAVETWIRHLARWGVIEIPKTPLVSVQNSSLEQRA